MAEEMEGGAEHTPGHGHKFSLSHIPVWVWVIGVGLIGYLTWRIIQAKAAAGSGQVNQSIPAGTGGVNTDTQAALDAQKAALEAEFASGLTTQGQDITKALGTQLTADESTIASLTTSVTKAQADAASASQAAQSAAAAAAGAGAAAAAAGSVSTLEGNLGNIRSSGNGWKYGI